MEAYIVDGYLSIEVFRAVFLMLIILVVIVYQYWNSYKANRLISKLETENQRLDYKLCEYIKKDTSNLLVLLNDLFDSKLAITILDELNDEQLELLNKNLTFIIKQCELSLKNNSNNDEKKRLNDICRELLGRKLVHSFDRDKFCDDVHNCSE
jgi:phosphoribosylformylglycinamidine (FGAM) synthase PurS component